MKYCSECKKIEFSENKNCSCGKKLVGKVDLNQPVKLVAVDELNKGIVEHTLVKAKIPYSEQLVNKVSPVMGVDDGNYVYYVPLSFLKKAIDALSGVSAMQIPEYYDKLDLPDDPEWVEMSPAKRRIVKALSVIGFIVIVYLCVAAVDIVANIFTSFTSIR